MQYEGRNQQGASMPAHRRCPALVVAAALLAALTGCATTGASKTTNQPRSLAPIPIGNSPARGPQDARVHIVEFSDFQCPFSAKVQPTLRELEAAYPGELLFVFKHLPLPMHPQAKDAALAAVEMADQGGFWAVQPILFSNMTALAPEDLIRYAQEAGLDGERVRAAEKSAISKAQLYADMALAGKLGATGTPTFFVNGRKLSGAKGLDAFRQLVDEELAKAAKLEAMGIARADVALTLTELNLSEGSRSGAQPHAAQPGAAPGPGAGERDEEIVYFPVNYGREHLGIGMPEDMAVVTMVVFTDYECPYCQRLEEVVSELLARYRGSIRIVYRHFPLKFHPHARLAAEAVQAAGDQGQHHAMHTRVLTGKTGIERADLVRLAAETGLDPARLEAALDDSRFGSLIDADLADAGKLGVTGTPTSFINGRKVVGARAIADFVRIIDEELARAKQAKESKGLSGRALYRHLTGLPTETPSG